METRGRVGWVCVAEGGAWSEVVGLKGILGEKDQYSRALGNVVDSWVNNITS